MQGVWGGSSGRVHVESYDYSTWKISSTAANVDPPFRRGDQDIQDVLPSEGGTEAVSCGGVPGGVSKKDDDAGALRAPARTRHCGDAGGGQPPPFHGVPGATYSSPGRRSMGATWGPCSVIMGRSGSGDGWQRRRRGKTKSGRSTPMGKRWRQCQISATLGGYSRRRMMTGRRWRGTFERRG